MGLYEFHGHLALGEQTTKEKLENLRKNNVVFFRDGGSSKVQLENMLGGLSIENLKELAKSYGIEYQTPVCALYMEGKYGKFLGESFSDMKDFSKKAIEMKSLGADYIKVMFSGIASFKNLGKLSCEPVSPADIKEIVHICHAEGLKVMAHTNGADAIKYAIDSETDSIEHGIFIDTQGLRMLGNSSTAWVPTIAAISNEVLRNEHKKAVRKGLSFGANILPGSDCGSSEVPIGKGTALEYEFLKDCGLVFR